LSATRWLSLVRRGGGDLRVGGIQVVRPEHRCRHI
jgi:hypothetical protein